MPKASPQQEPIAIIGIGCRFPGDSNSPDAFWKMMCAGTDTITEVPPDRWNTKTYYDPVPHRPGKSISKWGGFIKDVDKFDPEAFRISPREADWMDPQQRLLLEASWEALEDGGQNMDRLRGSSTGVFVGISTTDYFCLQCYLGERPRTDVYTATGTTISIAANRISYCFDFRGPSVAMDTACSSALTALHLACQSLWKGDCTLAITAGVNAILSPFSYIAFSRMGILSPTGRCQAFDAAANGFVRSEGVGSILLKPLSAALASGDRIYALIRATAANQDGRTNGIAVPSPIAQADLIRAACRRAGIQPRDIQYIEAHGTGTPVGDPIEAHALGTVLGEGRPQKQPCIVGSVKTNIGHLEAAAGIAGVIKLALVLKNGAIPPNIHFHQPNPNIDFAKLKLRVIQKLEPFPDSGPALGGVNSFGFGGANAHAILEGPPAAKPKRLSRNGEAGRKMLLLPLSARTQPALQALAKNYQTILAGDADLPSLCAATALRRTHHADRLYLIADSRAAMREKMAAYLAGENAPGVIAGNLALEPETAPVFVFSGQGPQWWGMGRQLLKTENLFRKKIAECDRYFSEFGSWSLLQELQRDENSSKMDDTAIAQPAIFAIQVALAALWQSWGVRPCAVLGHSVGEVAAAHVAGVLSLREAARVIFHRGRCMQLAHAQGRMLAAGLDAKQAEELIAPYSGRITVAAYNSPVAVTLSGEGPALEEISRVLEKRHVFNRFLQVKYAFHSKQMDPVKAELLKSLGRVELSRATLPMISTVTGRLTDGLDLDAGYWWRNVREPVRFSEAASHLIDKSRRLFLELGAHPALGVSLKECFAKFSLSGTVLFSLRRRENDHLMLLENVAALHLAGVPVDWSALYPESSADLALPLYPWQRERYWQEPIASREARLTQPIHPLLLRNLHTAIPTWLTWLDQDGMPWLREHRVQNHIVFPGAGYVETALGLGRSLLGVGPIVVEELDLQKALFLPENKDIILYQAHYNPSDFSLKISSRAELSDAEWTTNVVGKMRALPHASPSPAIDLEAVQKRCSAPPMTAKDVYDIYERLGFAYGPLFRGVEAVWRRDGECLARIRLPEPLLASLDDYQLHPVMLDCCFHAHAFSIPEKNPLTGTSLLPVFIERIKYFAKPGAVIWCHAKLLRIGARFAVWNIQILDEAGKVAVEIENFRSQVVSSVTASRADSPQNWIYQTEWRPKPLAQKNLSPAPAAFTAQTAEMADACARAVLARSPKTSSAPEKLSAGLDALAGLYLFQALGKLGVSLRPGQKLSAAALAKKIKMAPPQEKLLARLLFLTAGQGMISPDGVIRRLPARLEPGALWNKLIRQFPAAYPELTLLLRVGQSLDQILRGKLDVASLLTPGGSTTTLEHFYQDAPAHQAANQAVAETVAAVLKDRPRDQMVRILEVGGGTGGLTSYVLPKLNPDRTEYAFTDIQETLLALAEQKHFDYNFVKCQKFDLDIPPQEQTLELASFDLILVSDVLRFSANPRLALSHLHRLLASGGLLVLCERLATPAWFEFVFAPANSWKQPPLDRPFLLKLLAETNFIEPADVSVPPSVNISGLSLLLARPSAVKQGTVAAPLAVSTNAKPGSWLIFADQSGFAAQLAELLTRRGDQPILIPSGPISATEMVQLLAKTGANPLAGIIHLRSLDLSAETPLEAAEIESCHGVLTLVQSLTKVATLKNPRLWLVTRGAQPVNPGDSVAVTQSLTLGMGRAVLSEYRHIRSCLVDLTPGGAPTDAYSLLQQITADDPETEVAFRGPTRQVGRLARTSLEQHVPQPKGAAPYRLEITTPGVLDELRFRELRRRKPGAEEIEIEICAAALNFRDVMKALGIYPMESDMDLLLGDECSGRVVTVGRKVKDFKIGDEVIVSALGCFASHITVPALCAIKKPARITFEEAVTIPVTFMTAWYALHTLGQIKQGEKILIQAGTGGVGLAAIQIAQLAGAEVFATAGNPEKRDFLRAMGVVHVMDSRTLAFADEIRRITNGRGVDLVLNSLAGHAIEKGLSVLAPQGRYLEIGKRDVYGDTRIGLRPFRNNLSMFVIDMAQVILSEPARVRALFKPIIELIHSGQLNPLPHRILPVSKAITAFRLMAQARHIGKIVLSMQNDSVQAVRLPPKDLIRFPAKASYLITGGLGGFGLAVARWMVDRGARHLILTSRRGASTPEAKRSVAQLKRLGAIVTVAKSDVTKNADVQKLFRLIARKCPPLRGVFHTAAVIDDGILEQLTPARFTPVLAPKVNGAWHLHQASLRLKLDHFVMFSSISSLVGAAGQGNYVCANSFLDSMSHYRRSLGLPGLTINWGAIAEVGMIARNAHVEQHLTAHGVIGIPPSVATASLGRFLQSNATQIAFMHVDWQKYAGSHQAASIPVRYSELIHSSSQENTDGAAEIHQAILAMPPAKRLAFVAAHIREPVAKVLRTSAAKLDVNRPLKEMGLDSLMAVELLNRIEVRFGVSLPPAKLAAGGTILSIAEIVLELIAGDAAAPSPPDDIAGAVNEQLDVHFERVHLFRSEGSRPPLFLIHPAGGFTALYDHLAKLLPEELPVYGIQSRAFFDPEGEHPSVDSMAREYAALIMARQPEGPCRLAGFSLGGFFALATARELEARGRVVSLVGLIDTPLVLLEKNEGQEFVLGELVAEMHDYFSNALTLVPPVDPADLSASIADLVQKLKGAENDDRTKLIMEWLAGRGLELGGSTDNIAQKFFTISMEHAELIKTFQAVPIQSPIRLWNSGQSDAQNLRARPDGRRYTTGSFQEELLDGRHFELLHSPLVESLGERLDAALQETETSRLAPAVEVIAK